MACLWLIPNVIYLLLADKLLRQRIMHAGTSAYRTADSKASMASVHGCVTGSSCSKDCHHSSLSTEPALVLVCCTHSAYWTGITPKNRYHHAAIAAATRVVKTTLCSTAQLTPITPVPVAMMLHGWHQTGLSFHTSVGSSLVFALSTRSSACQCSTQSCDTGIAVFMRKATYCGVRLANGLCRTVLTMSDIDDLRQSLTYLREDACVTQAAMA